MPSAWSVSIAGSVGKPLQTQCSYMYQQISHHTTSLWSTLQRYHSPTQWPSPVSPALTLVQPAKLSATSLPTKNPPTLSSPVPSTHLQVFTDTSSVSSLLPAPQFPVDHNLITSYRRLRTCSVSSCMKNLLCPTPSKKHPSPLTSDLSQCLWSL